jgi:hypothetical protein
LVSLVLEIDDAGVKGDFGVEAEVVRDGENYAVISDKHLNSLGVSLGGVRAFKKESGFKEVRASVIALPETLVRVSLSLRDVLQLCGEFHRPELLSGGHRRFSSRSLLAGRKRPMSQSQ